MTGSAYVTKTFLDRMAEGIIPWHRKWVPGYTGASSWGTGKQHTLLNQCLLRLSDEYIGIHKALEMHADFRGVKTEQVVWASVYDKKTGRTDPTTGEEITERRFGYRTHTVLPVSLLKDADGNPFPHRKTLEGVDGIRAALSEGMESVLAKFLERTSITLVTAPALKPDFISESRTIEMPSVERYSSTEGYYADLCRQAVKATSLSDLLGGSAASSARAVAREELAAEMGSAMLMSAFEMDTAEVFDNSVAYVQRWQKRLREDNDCVIRASVRAEKAVNYILGLMELAPEA